MSEGAVKVRHYDDEPFNNNALNPLHSNILMEEDDAVFETTTKRYGMNLDMETVILDDDDAGAMDNGSPWSKQSGSDNESMWSKQGSPRIMRENRLDWSVSSRESSYPNSPERGAITASKETLRSSLPHGYANVRQVHKAVKKCYRNYVDMLCDLRDPRERAVKAKQLYLELCRHMPAYGSKVFQVKELSGNRIRKKVPRILCISARDISLLQPSTKSVFRSSPTHLLSNWCISSFKAGSGQLVLEFRGGARKWALQPSTFPELKAICACLSAVMQEVSNGGLIREMGPISRSTPASPCFGGHRDLLPPLPLSPLTSSTYHEEFERCKQFLCFPEEVALILTDTEYALFGAVPCGSYVRHVTNPNAGDSASQSKTEGSEGRTIKDLILRFREVSDWVTETLTTAEPDDKMLVLSRIIQVANTCWNIGNFNAIMEILEGLRSVALKPLMDSIEELGSESLLSLHETINNNTSEYRDAVDRAMCLPGCKLVPYFGVFIQQLEQIFEENTPTISLASEESGQEGGLLCTDKMFRASLVLNDIKMCQQATRQQCNDDQYSDDDDEDQDASDQSDCDQSSYVTCCENELLYEPINPVPNMAGIEIIPHHRLENHLHTVQCMHHGLTAVHWEDEGNRSALCVLKLDMCNSVLTWSKYQDLDVDAELLTPPIMCNMRYHSTIPIQGSLEEGYLELSCAKQVFVGHDSPDLSAVCRRHGLASGNNVLLTRTENCLSILFGTCITDNRLLHFVGPKRTIEVWYAGLTPILKALNEQQMYVSDQRTSWLEKEYLNLFYSKKSCMGPTPLDAIRSFGGKNALMKKPNDKSTGNNSTPDSPVSRRSFHHFKAIKKLAIKQKAQPPSPKVDEPQYHRKTVRKASSIRVKHKKKIHQRSHTTDLTGRAIPMVSANGEDSRSSSFDSSEPLRSMSADSASADMSDISMDNKPEDEYSSIERLGSLSSSLSKDDSLSYDTPPLVRQKSSSLTGSQNLITTHSNLSFPEFVELFKSFSLRCRKDLKDIFDSYSVTFNPKDCGKDSAIASLLRTKEDVDMPVNTILSLTRNTFIEPLNESNRRVADAIAASSVQSNSTGVQTVTTHVMGVEEMKQFLIREQEEDVTDDKILQYIQRHEPSALVREHQCISFEGFARYMMDKDNYAFNNEQQNAIKQELNHPLTHYWIASSHNTYLTGHQLRGESSIELYAQVLLTGCRCVELDCWDGDDGIPVIYHGHTLTTKINFKGVVEAINRAAFVASDYPVILSIENHCSLQQQVKMAQIFVETFGDKLVTKFMFDADFSDNPHLPSPSQLYRKILIKNKKLKANQMPPELLKHRMIKLGKALKADVLAASAADISEEEDEHEEFYEDAYEDIEDNLTYTGDDKTMSISHRHDNITDTSQPLDLDNQQRSTTPKESLPNGNMASLTLTRKISGGTATTMSLTATTGMSSRSAEDTHQTSPIPTKPAKKRKDTGAQQIAADLSNLVIYTQAVKFQGLVEDTLTTQKQKGSRKGSKGNVPSSTGLSPGSPSPAAKDTQTGEGGSSGQDKSGDVSSWQHSLLQTPKCYHCSSVNENNLKRLFRKFSWRFIEHSEYQLMRTYPAGMRIDSSNYNPIVFWAFGIQMVALNYQTEDANLIINATLFEQTGNCGYVLKPSFLWDKNDPRFKKFNAYDKTIDGLTPKELTVSIVSGQFLCPSNPTASPYVEVEVVGIPSDCAKWKTKAIPRNAINPIWDEAFTFHIAFEDLAFLRLSVYDGTGSGVITQRCIPVKWLKTGFRHVRLRSPSNRPQDLPSLFIHTRLEEVQDVVSQVISENQRKRQMLSDMLHYHLGKEKDDKMEFAEVVDGRELKRMAHPVIVYGVLGPSQGTTLKATQDTKVHEIIAQGLGWGDHNLDEMPNYSLVEEVQETWEEEGSSRRTELGRIEERTLEVDERILEAQNTWTGRGRFILKYHGSERHRSDEWTAGDSGESATGDKTFLVWVYNVSTEQPYTVFRASTSSTAQDIIAQAMAKARRLDTDPSNFWLVEEVYKEWRNTDTSTVKKDITDKVTSRVLDDEDNVYDVQDQWKTPGRFTLKERDEGVLQLAKGSGTGFAFRRLASMRTKRQLSSKGRPITPPPLSSAGKKASTLPNDFKPGDLVKNGATSDQVSDYTPPPKGAMAAKSNFVIKMRKWKAGSGSSS